MSVATIHYQTPPAIVIPVAERANPLANAKVVVRDTGSVTTIGYGSFTPHVAKLRKLETDSSLWPAGSEPPSPDTVAWASIILDHLADKGFAPTCVVASAEGGTAVCFVEGDRYADIESLNSGVILGVLSRKQYRPVVWEIEQNVPGIARAVDRIRGFFKES